MLDPDNMILSLADLLSVLFILALGAGVVTMAVFYVVDIRQSRDAVRRNYPVIGRFRGLFKTLGEFFRHYFFAMDREEMPFNRAQRNWIALSSEGRDNTAAFGSTRSMTAPGTIIFPNSPFPPLETEHAPPPVTFGPDTPNPYVTDAVIAVSGMSYGALSRPAVAALSRGAALAGCWMNTGEGGLTPMHLEGGCDLVFQIGTAKYGVRDAEGRLDPERLARIAATAQVRMIEVKLSQGAKPGKGGMLPARKVTPEIARIRGIPVGRDSISPNRHEEIGSTPELLDFIDRVRRITGLPTGFKTVIGQTGWLDELCAEILRRGPASAPDFITVDGGDGGTGAAPMPLMDNVGLTLREALPMLCDALIRHGLRERVRVVASGKLITPVEVAWAYCAGADMVVTARGFMFALGCIQALKCNRNTCPTGITTHDPRLQQGLVPAVKAERVANYAAKILSGTGLIAHACGVPHLRALERRHCRVVMEGGLSVPLDRLFPPPAPPPMAGSDGASGAGPG